MLSSFRRLYMELAIERLHKGDRKTVAMKTVTVTEAEAVGIIVSQAFELDSMSHCAGHN